MFRKIILIVLFFFFMFWVNNSFARDQAAIDAEKAAIEKQNSDASKRTTECNASWDCIDKPNYMISTTEMFNFWWKWAEWSTSKEKINNLLNWKLIQNLMIALWVVSLFVMTVWAWYIIAYHGQDEFLSRWKSIFVTWIVSLIIALTSYYMVSLVRYIIFT